MTHQSEKYKSGVDTLEKKFGSDRWTLQKKKDRIGRVPKNWIGSVESPKNWIGSVFHKTSFEVHVEVKK